MSNLYLSVANYAKQGIATISSSGSASGFPVSSLFTHSLAEFYRSLSRVDTQTIVFNSVRSIGIVGALKTNFTSEAKWRIRLYSDASATSLVYDSGLVPCFFQYSGIGDLPWGEFVWGSGFGSFDGSEPRVKNCAHVIDSPVLARTLVIDIFDPDVTKEQYLQQAKVWAGSTFVPPEGALYGSSLISNDRATMKEMESGVRIYSEPRIVRGMSLDLELRKDALVKGLFSGLYFEKGKTADMLVYLEPDSPQYQSFQLIYGNLTELKELSQSSWRRLTTNLTVMERV